MAGVRPIPGMHYDTSRVHDLATVICPPYDIISPKFQEELYRRDEYNFVRLEYGYAYPEDTPENNRYTRARVTLDKWLGEGVLVRDAEPAIYLHDQYYTYRGRELRRRGMIVRVHLEEWDRMVVRPHENTMSAPKGDRLSLLTALQANTSPVLTMFEDRTRVIADLLEEASRERPFIHTSIVDGERHDVWAITDAEIIKRIGAALASEALYVADGHHRYESALAYRNERRASLPEAPDDAPFNFVMMTLVSFTDPGLLVLPPHRLVRGLTPELLSVLLARLQEFFTVKELPLDTPELWTRAEEFLTGGEIRLAAYGPLRDTLLLLALHDHAAADRLMPPGRSEIYHRLDVSVIDHVILEHLLGLEKEGPHIGFTYDRQDAIDKVRDGTYQLALILGPVRPEVIKAIADVADKMPRKSTYFYPKLPSGIIMNPVA